MRKLVYYVGVSLDGYIAGPSGEYDFYPVGEDLMAYMNAQFPEVVPAHVRQAIGLEAEPVRYDTLIMGRGTYEPALAVDIASPYSPLRQYVVSTTLGVVDHPDVEVTADDPIDLVRRLKQEQGRDIYLAGGGKLAASLLPEIDEMIVKLYPVVAGTGIPAFSGEFRPTMFTLTDTRTFDNGTLALNYIRA
ncbi:dihydrofolate reductase [Rhodococcus spelaei]|uniref:Dihydrofolate reductase n=1 Tax=Rhodococcus spelaei TaxID=2546320 RepID=A0A541BRX5_9NOCA|nr:dihydrofolate reductase family protein [Rhodococcus spelaei]TQF75035.1 dihydrofolate reductase [Rhodococcus spelaei]